MAHNTGNPIGSTSPKDLSDNARNLDLLLLGDDPSYPDRKGVPRKSWKGMEAEYVADRLRRATEFHTAQTEREAQFKAFLDASGYEAPVPYAPGLTLERATQTVTYLGNEYRVKSQFLPLLTTNWAGDESNLKLIGDDSLRQDMANFTDPAKGAAILGRGVVSIASISDLQFVRRDTSQSLKVSAFYPGVFALAAPGEGDHGQGWFKWAPAVPRAAHNGGTVISPTIPWNGTPAGLAGFLSAAGETAPTGVGCFVRVFDGPVSVKWFGATGDGVTNDYGACVKAHATGRNVHYPAGDYSWSSIFGLQILPGVKVTGEGSGRFSGIYQKTKTTIRNIQPGGGIFWYTNDSTTGAKESLNLAHIELLADNPVRLNPLEGVVADGAASNIPYLMKPVLFDLSLAPLTLGAGIGCALTKVFDGSITQCDFRGFGTQLLLQGCDLNVVKNNRLINLYDFGILELGVSTFGSQNQIEHNDLVTAMDVRCVFIKSTSRHVRIRDNYLEQGSGGANACKGFIDVSATDVPVYGSNGPSNTRFLSTIVEGNRLDGHAKATDFIYRLEPVGIYTKIHDTGTSGLASTVNWLTVEGGGLPLFKGSVNACIYDFFGGTQISSNWRNFKTGAIEQGFGGISFNSKSFLGLDQSSYGLRSDNADQHVRLTPRGVVLKNTLTTPLFCILPMVDGVANQWLASGVTFNVTVVARAKTSSATLRLLNVVNKVRVEPYIPDTVVGTQEKVIRFTMVGAGPNDKVGLGMLPVASTDDIEIRSVSFVAA